MNYDEYERKEHILLAILAAFLLLTVIMLSAYIASRPDDTTQEFELWDAKCPFGHYYSRVEGGGWFLGFDFDSSLGEGYVFKYFENDVLRTLIVESTETDCRIHLTNDSSHMWMVVHFEGKTLETWQDEGHDWIWMDVYVPDPKVMV